MSKHIVPYIFKARIFFLVRVLNNSDLSGKEAYNLI